MTAGRPRILPRQILRAAAIAAAVSSLAACNSETLVVPVTSFDASQATSATANAYAMIGRPYSINGKTYVPAEDPDYSEVGIASWYGADFHGGLTADGEVYNMNALTAAHKTLPLPSYVRVTNLDNGASLVVRLNDRGPFVDGRIIDLSARAAALLDMTEVGTARVRVDYIGPASVAGSDERMLLASYQPPTAIPSVDGGPVMVASDDRGLNPFSGARGDGMFRPAALSAGSDPLGNLLQRANALRGYADTGAAPLAPAQSAAAALAAGIVPSPAPASPAFAAAFADESSALIQIGVFSDRANADRMAAILGPFGSVAVTELPGDGERWSVRLEVTETLANAALVAAAEGGATDAYRLR